MTGASDSRAGARLGAEERRADQLKISARTVTACLTRDEQQIPDPWDLLQSSYSRDYLPAGNAGEAQFQIKRVHVIPDILMAQFEGRDCCCFMGLLEAIGRVWMTVDNKLFLWDYSTGRDFTCFEELSQIIIDVRLVRPKAGIFVPSIRFLLVLVTASELVLLGVSFAEAGDKNEDFQGDLLLHRTGLRFPTDEISMLSIIGSKSGRIFAGGQDGNVYEFIYQAEDGWFTRKCRKLNRTASAFTYFTPTFLRLSTSASSIIATTYDAERDLLYALGEDSSIQVFHLGPADSGFERIAHCSDIFEQASRLCPTGVLNKKGFKVVSINAVKAQDSAFIHLVAVTSSFVKLYFTTLKRDERALSRSQLLQPSAPGTPGIFELVHVRLAPEEGHHRDAKRLIHSFSPNIHTAFFQGGVTIAANSISDAEDVALFTALNQAVMLSSARNVPLESTDDLIVEGKIWDIDEITGPLSVKPTMHLSSSFLEAASPLAKSSREFLLLTNAGVYLVAKSSPIDELKRVLIEANGNVESAAIRSFFETFSPDQACFLTVVLACTIQNSWKNFSQLAGKHGGSDSKSSVNLAIWALNAMIKYGGEPRVIESTLPSFDYPSAKYGGPGASSSSALPLFGSRIEYEFSHLHRGLYLYFARLVSGFWNQSVLKMHEPSAEALMALHSFSEFLERNPGLCSRTVSSVAEGEKSYSQRDSQQKLEEAYHAENESIKTLAWLVRATLELLSFLAICRDYNVLESAIRYHPGSLVNAEVSAGGDSRTLDFEELLTSSHGKELISDIGSAIVHKQLKMCATVDSLCQVLVQRCPTFFGDNEIVVYQGMESLERASISRDPTERRMQLLESLKLFLHGCRSISFPALKDICHRYEQVAFFVGVVELCLAAAAAHDEESIALAAFKSPGLPLTLKQQEIISARDSIYSLVFEALRAVHGLDTVAVAATVGAIDPELLQREVLAAAVRSQDELFHMKLYDWLVSEHLGSLLLDIETPFILPFLESKYAARDDLCKDLFWKYLARHGRFMDAAKILDSLASSPEFSLNLAERIERLSLALGNARTQAGASLEANEYTRDLEERLDVAKLQNEILEAVFAKYGEVSELLELNCTLYGVSQLFNRFAKSLKLWECSLRIIHCSSYQDPLLVHQIWTKIFEEAMAGKQFDVLAQKFAELVKKLYPSPFAFPVHFVIDSLMLLAYKHSRPAEWVAGTLINSGLPPLDILEQLCEFARSTGTFWTRPENIPYLINVFLDIAEKTLQRESEARPRLQSITSALVSAPAAGEHAAPLAALQERLK